MPSVLKQTIFPIFLYLLDWNPVPVSWLHIYHVQLTTLEAVADFRNCFFENQVF